jgi:large conductance mechanosensitive channel
LLTFASSRTSLASAFTAIVSSLTTDVLLPIVSLLPFLNRNLEEKFAVLHPGPNAHNSTGYQTVEQALSDGAVVLAYGNFLDKCFRFIAVGVTLYVVARTYGWVAKDDIIKKKVKCRYCRKQISEKVRLFTIGCYTR